MQNSFNLIFVGDIVGRPGRQGVKERLKSIVKRHNAVFVIANGENSANGFGITSKVAQELFAAGIHVITLGNHTWDKKEAEVFLDEEPHILRPANFSPYAPGRGSVVIENNGVKLGVISLIGQVFMGSYESPFLAAERIVSDISAKTKNIIIDFHGEATSEKKAMAFFLDGQVSAVLGTHTHVQTADVCILKKGTAFITDAGMTGPHDSVIGNCVEDVLDRFVRGMPRKLEVASGDVRISYVVIEIDVASGKAFKIERCMEKVFGGDDEGAA
jgi:metallophosphoesterase (TIGR00282 family)